jgi:hypothetical protein
MSAAATDLLDDEQDYHYPMHQGVCASCARNVPVAACFVQTCGGEREYECCKPCIAFLKLWQVCMSWWWR